MICVFSKWKKVHAAEGREATYISEEEHRRILDESNVEHTRAYEEQTAAYRKSLEELEAKHRREAEAVLSAATTHNARRGGRKDSLPVLRVLVDVFVKVAVGLLLHPCSSTGDKIQVCHSDLDR
jgi:hypothetical protein